MNERRIASRTEVLQSGMLLLGISEIPCTVRNLSATGACLVVETTMGIPAVFQLATANQTARTCKVRWRRATTLGISFR
jgi:hypothetical protein